MFVWATRAASAWIARAAFYVGLFLFVVVLQVAVTSALRAAGWEAGPALVASGAVVLGFVLAVNFGVSRVLAQRAGAREEARKRLGLPDGPCCVIWRAGGGEEGEDAMPWSLAAPLRTPYPALARQCGVEGVALVDFEIGADGAARHIACIEAWPTDQFFDSAAAALREARFVLKPGAKPRFGASYRMPFVFRIAGAARLKDQGQRALPHRPLMIAAVRAAEKAAGQLAKRA